MEPMKPMAPMKPMEPMKPLSGGEAWWPKDLGQPASSAGQDGLRYATFPDRHRVAVEKDGKVTVYDTGSRELTGVQSGGGALTFTGPDGSVRLDELKEAG